MPKPGLKPPSASRQISFHQLLVGARKTWLRDALAEALRRIDPNQLRSELGSYVPVDVQRILAAAGLRDEYLFPAPLVLATKPTLVGYYRLLLGVPQKTFYGAASGMGMFKSMERRGVLNNRQKAALPEFCKAMSEGLADLVRQMSPSITPADVHDLPLLTIGSQFQGANNNLIGAEAIREVFLGIREIVQKYVTEEYERKLVLKNSAGRKVLIVLAADPDVRIQEELGGRLENRVAIEIKGGTDKSNAHNRAGEAEKSHRKAKRENFRDFWTIIATKGLDIAKLRAESPTTSYWFDAAQVLGRVGEDWREFRTRLAGELGIPA